MTDKQRQLKNFLYAFCYGLTKQEKEDLALRVILILLDEAEE